MTISTSNGLIGLSLLSGTNLSGSLGAVTVESRAVRLAKAQFTTPAVTPPWKEAASPPPLASQVSAVKRMTSIIEEVQATGSLPPDVRTAFTAYRALDRLRVLAEFALRSGTSVSERLSLQNSFAQGVADLQRYLASAPSDRLTLSLGQVARRAESVKLQPVAPAEVAGAAVTKDRFAALAGLTGSEKFSLKIRSKTNSDEVTVDLAAVPQPPTLDKVAGALNAAIAAVPQRNGDGTVVLDANGQAVPKWKTTFSVVKSADGWGLQLNSMGIEQVSLDEIGAGDVLMVAAGQSSSGSATATRMMRFDLPAGAINRTTSTTLNAADGLATAEAALHPAPKSLLPDAKAEPVRIAADLQHRASVTDKDGFTYLVGPSGGDLGANLGDRTDDMVLTKVDGRGEVIWQRSLGAAGTASGAAISLAPNGDLVIAGTVTGSFDGATADGDMLVARYTAAGDEKSATLVRSLGADSANAVAVGRDGSIYVGGRAAGGGGDAFLARLDSTGKLAERRRIDSGGNDVVRALAIGPDGNLLALTSESGSAVVRRLGASSLAADLGTVTLGSADARALAVADDGSIAVAGETVSALAGTQVNSLSGRDGFVTHLDAALGSARTTYVGSSGDDQLDSIGFLGGKLYAGGRTTGALGGTRAGAVDGFVARVDPLSGAIETTSQWGRTGVTTGAVLVSTAPGGEDRATRALGLRRGILNPESSALLTAQTSLRAGDEFSFRVDGGALRKLTITAADTVDTLATRIGKLAGRSLTVSTAKTDGGRVLRIEARAGHEVELLRGSEGKDALAKLGLQPARLVAPAATDPKAPRVQPGGNYGLDLSPALSIANEKSAALALSRVQSALSVTQTAFRSLYWDENKAALVNGSGGGGSVSAYQSAQLGRYQDALNRLSTTSTSIGF